MSTIKKISAQEIVNSFFSSKNSKELKITYGINEETEIDGKIDLSSFVNLENLTLGAGIFSALDTDKLKGLSIKELSIDIPLIREKDFDLKNFPNLIKLYIFGYSPLNSLNLTANTKLEVVELYGEIVNNFDLKLFSHLVNLKKLELKYINGSYKSLEKCVNLEHLSVEGSYYFEVSKEGLESLNLDKLKYLYLDRQYLPYAGVKSSYPETNILTASDSLGRMLEPYDWNIKAWKKDIILGPDNSVIQLRFKLNELLNKVKTHKIKINQIINE